MTILNIRHLQLLAIASVEDPDWPAQYRQICRWYSKEFHTPLKVVEMDLTSIYVLTHYYETTFGALNDSEIESSQIKYEEIKESLMDFIKPDPNKKIKEADDDDWANELIDEIKENDAKIKAHTGKVESTEAMENPNIEDDIEFSVQGEDPPPDF